MTGASLLQRAEALLERVERYERRRRDTDDVLAIRQAHDEFAEHLAPLTAALAQAQRLRDRGERVSLPDGGPVAGLVRNLLESIRASADGVRERAETDRSVRQHVRAVEAEVEAATRAYVERARRGLDLGLVDTLRQVGLAGDADRLRPALMTLARASQELPQDDEALARVDSAAAEVESVTAALEEPTQARVLTFLRTLIASGGEVSFEDIDCGLLDELKKTGAAKNFIVTGKTDH